MYLFFFRSRNSSACNDGWFSPQITVLEFCLTEKPVLLSIRLDVLCDSKCEDIALKLVAVVRRCLRLDGDRRFLEASTAEQRDNWLDLHLALLHRFKKSGGEWVPLIQQLLLEDGLRLVQRFIDRGVPSVCRPRVWRNSLKIAELACQCLLTDALMRCPPPACLPALAVQLVRLERETLGQSSQALTDMLHKLVDNNDKITSAHMYVLCDALAKQFGDELKPFCIELSVRALAIDLNDLEKQKLNAAEEAVKVAEIGLAKAFSSLAELVSQDLRICREVALTAFSLHPTQERLDKLTELAARGATPPTAPLPDASPASHRGPLQSSNVHVAATTAAVKSERGLETVVGEPPPGSGGGPGGGGGGECALLNGGCPEVTVLLACSPSSQQQVPEAAESLLLASGEDADSGVELSDGATNAESPLADAAAAAAAPVASVSPTETAIFSKEAARGLGVSESVINDLAVVVHSQRWQVLSWKKGWEELEPLCKRYVCEHEAMRSVTKELLFLKLDYSQFKDMPRPERDEFYGIEKGYENCIVDPDDHDGGEEDVGKAEEEDDRGAAVLRPQRHSGKRKKKKAVSKSSRPSSDRESSAPASADELAGASVERKPKKAVRKKWMRKVTACLKTSSDSDSPTGNPNKTSAAVKSASKAPCSTSSLARNGSTKRSAGVKSVKVFLSTNPVCRNYLLFYLFIFFFGFNGSLYLFAESECGIADVPLVVFPFIVPHPDVEGHPAGFRRRWVLVSVVSLIAVITMAGRCHDCCSAAGQL